MSTFVNTMHPLAPNPPPSGGLFSYVPKPPVQRYQTMRWYHTDGYQPLVLTAQDHDEEFVAYRPVNTSTDTLGAPALPLNTRRPVIGERATAARTEYAFADAFLMQRDTGSLAWHRRHARPCRVGAEVYNTVVGNGEAMGRYHPAFDPYMGQHN